MKPKNTWAAEPTLGAELAERMRREGIPHLDGACVRWDAAERCLVVWTLDGREVRIK